LFLKPKINDEKLAFEMMEQSKAKIDQPLRRGWTTGACATASTKAALNILLGEEIENHVSITLPKGQVANFEIAYKNIDETFCEIGVIKDAGDDPDVTHGSMIKSKICFRQKDGKGILFHAGKGVGTVTLQGLPIDIGEAAINPVPREMMRLVVEEAMGIKNPDIDITISVPKGEEIAQKTWNPRLGIKGGISILGTTGIVIPYSCSAWIHAIHRGIDVAQALGHNHIIGATGKTSEASALTYFQASENQMIDMGDFVGGMLKYVKKQPIEKVTIAGGFAKIVKLAQGHYDLHSGRSQVDFEKLAKLAQKLEFPSSKIEQITKANTALEVLSLLGEYHDKFCLQIAKLAQQHAVKLIHQEQTKIDIIIFDRQGQLLSHYDEI